jgi:hypothetical protein
MKTNAALHVDMIARGRRALSGPRGGGEGWGIVVGGVTGPLEGNACVAGPTMEMAAWVGSQASFTLADNRPPCQGTRQFARQ